MDRAEAAEAHIRVLEEALRWYANEDVWWEQRFDYSDVAIKALAPPAREPNVMNEILGPFGSPGE